MIVTVGVHITQERQKYPGAVAILPAHPPGHQILGEIIIFITRSRPAQALNISLTSCHPALDQTNPSSNSFVRLKGLSQQFEMR
jgi:hypothetical protein